MSSVKLAWRQQVLRIAALSLFHTRHQVATCFGDVICQVNDDLFPIGQVRVTRRFATLFLELVGSAIDFVERCDYLL